MKNWKKNPIVGTYVKWTNGIRTRRMLNNKYIPQENLEQEIIEYEQR